MKDLTRAIEFNSWLLIVIAVILFVILVLFICYLVGLNCTMKNAKCYLAEMFGNSDDDSDSEIELD